MKTSTSSTRQNLSALWESMGMLVVFILLFIAMSVFVPNFLSAVNMKGLALSVATVGIIACTMLFCLAAGDFDLSIGSVVALSGVLAAVVINRTGSVGMGITAGILAGGVVGVVNGTVIARIGINALITTLATMQIVRGFSYIVSDGKAIGVRESSFFSLGISSFLNIPTPVWIMIVCFIFFGLLLNKTIFGRNTLAIGGNAEAARLAGIGVTATKVIIFTLQGLIAGFAGVILASRMTSGQPTTAQGLELKVISACVLGGVSLTGGVGTMTGVIVGVLIMGTVENAMNLKNVEPFYQYVASGSILLAAVLFDRLKQPRRV
ncbi:MAG: L-arabinose transport system permease protein [Chthoniobacter sp.]|jgi:L-arabinose transport system permease protein|nr:L-arabinose transport system permease protein [Chthoniobacter sp.]